MASYDHYETYEWLGTFWTPDQSIEFPGKLTYAPGNGIQLEFFFPMQGKKIERAGHIHGVLSTGELCTLYGDFDPNDFGVHSGKVSIYRGDIQFSVVLFGEHLPIENKLDGAWLDFTNFQEFCHPQGYKDFVKYSAEPIQKASTGELEISLINSGRFKFPSNNLENQFHSENGDVANEIGEFFQGLKEKYPNDFVRMRTDIGWTFEIRANNGFTIFDIRKKIYSLENFISLLVYSPIRRKVVSLMRKSQTDTGRFDALPMLTDLFDMDKFKIEILKKPLIHLHLPITARNSNIAELFAKWLDAEDGFELFSSIISNNFGKTYQHELYAEIVLILTQLEAISYSFGKKQKRSTYLQ